MALKIPFKTPIDYWVEALNRNPENINNFPGFQIKNPEWYSYDCDLHIYPYVHAVPAILSMGCPNRCYFCPTAKEHQGQVHFGDPEKILPYYKDQNVHFMDENFFCNDLDKVLPLLKKYNIKWLAMTSYQEILNTFNKYGEDYLHDCGLRIIEVGLENVVLMKKVKAPIQHDLVEIYYLNMTFLPGETKESIKENGKWMYSEGLKHPIHFNNGVWYAPGQFYYPYEKKREDGKMFDAPYARTRPTFVPYTFLDQDFEITNMEMINYYSQLSYDFKMYPKKTSGLIREFVGDDYKKVIWLAIGLRTGGIL